MFKSAITAAAIGAAVTGVSSTASGLSGPASEVRIAPNAETGSVGAWLAAGPFPAKALTEVPAGVDESALAPVRGASLGADSKIHWDLVSAHRGRLDLKRSLADGAHGRLVAYVGGVLHVADAGRYYVTLGSDDGVRVFVDGRAVLTRDEARPVREDDDVIALDLTPGDHTIVFKVHQRGGAWGLTTRVVDAAYGSPRAAHVRLPGTNADDARELASRLASVLLDRALDGARIPAVYRPIVQVRFPDGAPLDIPLDVHVKVAGVFDLAAGAVPITEAGSGLLDVALPPLPSPTGAITAVTTVAGHDVDATLTPRPEMERALGRATRALEALGSRPLREGSRESVQHLVDLAHVHLAKGDADESALADEARELETVAAAIEKGQDPYDGRSGPMRRALTSRLDGHPTEFGLYVPTSFRPGADRRYPLVIALHGLNGRAMSMLRWVFGGDHPRYDQVWEDRHMGPLAPFDGFVVTPFAHGNTMYREMGEEDVLQVMEWAVRSFPIDPSRVTITGPSMGGIGSAGIPLHHPHVFAAAAPLCGYHSYLIRQDIVGGGMKSWERFLLEERSNAYWAENGARLPLWIVHGTKDLPEENSGVLIERYEKLGYSVRHDHPDLGHNVWQSTYEGLKGVHWLARHRLDLHPAAVRFKTTRTRWGRSAWVQVDELASPPRWSEVTAWAHRRTEIDVRTTGVDAITLDRDAKLIDLTSATQVRIDGQSLVFDPNEAIKLRRRLCDGGRPCWLKGPDASEGVVKRGHVSGPIHDVFHEPILFVYPEAGTDARASERVARAFASGRGGVQIDYPVVSDEEFLRRREPLANDRALFLVGRENRVLQAIESQATLPIKVEAGAVVLGDRRIAGKELGAAFIHPNPVRPDRYIVVIAGTDVAGTIRALSLPSLLPDYVVWDAQMAAARGRVLFGAVRALATGWFNKDWSLSEVTRTR